MEVPVDQFVGWVSQLVWTLVRITGFVLVVPVFANQLIPARVKIALCFAIALPIAPIMPPLPPLTQMDLMGLLGVLLQSFAGIALGFATMLFFQLFVVAGQFVAMQMGLGFAAMVDPGNGVQVTVWSQFYLMLVTLTYLALDGHLILLDVLITGFTLFEFGVSGSFPETALFVAQLGTWMFSGGALIALPGVCALLVVNLAFGVMSRSAPQLNVFSLGFPFALLFGLLVIWWAIQSWDGQYARFFAEFMQHIARGLR